MRGPPVGPRPCPRERSPRPSKHCSHIRRRHRRPPRPARPQRNHSLPCKILKTQLPPLRSSNPRRCRNNCCNILHTQRGRRRRSPHLRNPVRRPETAAVSLPRRTLRGPSQIHRLHAVLLPLFHPTAKILLKGGGGRKKLAKCFEIVHCPSSAIVDLLFVVCKSNHLRICKFGCFGREWSVFFFGFIGFGCWFVPP